MAHRRPWSPECLRKAAGFGRLEQTEEGQSLFGMEKGILVVSKPSRAVIYTGHRATPVTHKQVQVTPTLQQHSTRSPTPHPAHPHNSPSYHLITLPRSQPPHPQMVSAPFRILTPAEREACETLRTLRSYEDTADDPVVTYYSDNRRNSWRSTRPTHLSLRTSWRVCSALLSSTLSWRSSSSSRSSKLLIESSMSCEM